MTKPQRYKPARTGSKKVSTERRLAVEIADGLEDASAAGSLVLPNAAQIATLALDLGKMIEAARQQVARTANVALTTLYSD